LGAVKAIKAPIGKHVYLTGKQVEFLNWILLKDQTPETLAADKTRAEILEKLKGRP
jgi:hypothetical protein